MSSNQFIAKVGVFLLVALNLGAYYFFWPGRSQQAPSNDPFPGDRFVQEPVRAMTGVGARRDVRGTQVSTAEESTAHDQDTRPGAVTAGNLGKTAKSEGRLFPGEPGNAGATDIELPAIPSVPSPDGGLPPIPDVGLPKPAETVALNEAPKKDGDPTLELLKKAKEPTATGLPALPPAEGDPVAPGPIKADNSPWSLQMEISAGQTLLVARLNRTQEFKITCQRVEMKTPDGALLAIGKVSITGPGLKGVCDRLTLPLNEDRLGLEGKAEVHIEQRTGVEPKGEFFRQSGSPTAELRGEKLSLRLAVPPAATPPEPAIVPAGGALPSGGPDIVPASDPPAPERRARPNP